MSDSNPPDPDEQNPDEEVENADDFDLGGGGTSQHDANVPDDEEDDDEDEEPAAAAPPTASTTTPTVIIAPPSPPPSAPQPPPPPQPPVPPAPPVPPVPPAPTADQLLRQERERELASFREIGEWFLTAADENQLLPDPRKRELNELLKDLKSFGETQSTPHDLKKSALPLLKNLKDAHDKLRMHEILGMPAEHFDRQAADDITDDGRLRTIIASLSTADFKTTPYREGAARIVKLCRARRDALKTPAAPAPSSAQPASPASPPPSPSIKREYMFAFGALLLVVVIILAYAWGHDSPSEESPVSETSTEQVRDNAPPVQPEQATVPPVVRTPPTPPPAPVRPAAPVTPPPMTHERLCRERAGRLVTRDDALQAGLRGSWDCGHAASNVLVNGRVNICTPGCVHHPPP